MWEIPGDPNASVAKSKVAKPRGISLSGGCYTVLLHTCLGSPTPLGLVEPNVGGFR